jgi:hypothetical protein
MKTAKILKKRCCKTYCTSQKLPVSLQRLNKNRGATEKVARFSGLFLCPEYNIAAV